MAGEGPDTSTMTMGAPGSGEAPAPPQPGPAVQPETPTASASIPEQPMGNSPTAVNKAHPNWGDKIYHGVLDALGGSHDVALQRDPETGKMVATVTKRAPGTQWKQIIAGALTGAAAASQAAPGPGQVMRGFGAGVQAGAKQAVQRNQQQRSQANEDFEAEQNAAYNKARTAMLNQDLSMKAFELQRMGVTAQFEDAARENQLVQSVANGGMGSQDLGVAKTFQDVLALHKDMPDLVNQQAHGNIIGIPHVNADGKIDGMHYALVTPEWKAAKLDSDQMFYKLEPPKKPGEKPTVVPYTVKAGTMSNGDFWNARMGAEKEIIDNYMTSEKQKSEDKLHQSQEAENYASAAEKNATTKILNDTGQLPGRPSSAAEEVADWGPGGSKGFNTWHNQMVVPAISTETSYRMASNAYNEYKAAAAKGKTLPSGAQSMLMLSQHLNTTFGTVKGSRITKDMIEHHLGARSVSDTLQVAVQKLVNGDTLSKSQWDAFGQLISEKRNEQWTQVMKDAVATGRPLDRIPFPDDFRQANGLAPGRTAPSNQMAPQQPQQQQQQSTQPAAPLPGAGKSISLKAARALPQYANETDEQIAADAKKLGYTVTQ